VNASTDSRDGEHPQGLAARRQGSNDARLQADGAQVTLFRVALILLHVAAHDRLAVGQDVLEDGARDGARRSGREECLVFPAGVRHDERVVTLCEHDRQPVEVEHGGHLGEEARQRLLVVE
jgi:hypothetical protein